MKKVFAVEMAVRGGGGGQKEGKDGVEVLELVEAALEVVSSGATCTITCGVLGRRVLLRVAFWWQHLTNLRPGLLDP